MTDSKSRVRGIFLTEDGQRTDTLDRARACARLTKPWVLPEEGRTEGEKLYHNNQSIGSRGVSVVQGKLLLSLFPPDQPWFQAELDPDFKFDPDISHELKNAIQYRLWLMQLQMSATLESAHIKSTGKRGVGFRVAKHSSIGQLIVTGDTLEELTDDYQLKVHRRDRYVTKRDDTGTALFHCTKERIDGLSLSDEDLSRAKLSRRELASRSLFERMTDVYTLHEWQPLSNTWVLSQEVNGHIIREYEEPEPRVFSTPFELVGGENFGHGLVEQNFGDLATLDEMEAKLREAIANMARMVPVIDTASSVQEEDLLRPSGQPIRARVVNGAVQDIAFLQSQKNSDIAAVSQYIQMKARDLARAFMLESAIQPQKERVTAFQIQRVAEEVEGALGGLFIPISEHQQLPLIKRLYWQMKRDKLIPAMRESGERAVRFKMLTGLSALARQATVGRVVSFANVVAQLGPQAMARIDEGVLIRMLERANNFYEPGLVKSDERMEQERRRAIQSQAQVALNEQLAGAAGSALEAAVAGEGA